MRVFKCCRDLCDDPVNMSPPKKASYRERMQKKMSRVVVGQISAIEEKFCYLKQNMDKKDIMRDVGACRAMIFDLPADLDCREELKTRFFKIQRIIQSRVLWETQTLSRLAPILDWE